MKKKIVVPVDFSMASLDAYIYARELAKIYDARIEVVHVHQGTLDADEVPGFKPKSDKKEVLAERLEDFARLYPVDEGTEVAVKVPVKTRMKYGFVVRSLINISQEELVTMIVMGATGENDAVGRFLGSVSSDLAQRAYCPVLLVPRGMKFKPYKNILYSSNYESADKGMLNRIIDFNKTFSATLHFTHINYKTKSRTYDAIEEIIFDKLFEKGDPKFAFNLNCVKASSVSDGLFNYADENNIDLIVMVNRERGFFESIFGKSLTKKMALRTKIPLLAYHNYAY